MKILEYVGPEIETDDNGGHDFFRVLELPERGAPYNPNEVVFMDFGSCNGHEPALFDTNTAKGRTSQRGSVNLGGKSVPKKDAIAAAKGICRSCPVIGECMSFIMKYPEQEGIWAATLPEDRGQA